MVRQNAAPAGARRAPVVIACDESGYEGEKLIGTTTDVFAHAGVHLDAGSAAECLRELRARVRSPATEYKANHLLREKHRSVLVWLLGPSGPLLGNAHVYLLDKEFHVVSAITGLLADDTAGRAAVTLYRLGPRTFGPAPWRAFLVAANDVLRGKDRSDVRTPVDAFVHAVDLLCRAGVPAAADGMLRSLRRAGPRAQAFRALLRDDPATLSPVDPLIPAIVRAVAHWGTADRPVDIVHHRQTTLSRARVAQLAALVDESTGTGRLAGLSLADSAVDLRVQIADILAGAARKIASDELNERGDDELTALLRPYLDGSPSWGDDRSWFRLTGAAGRREGDRQIGAPPS